MSGKSSLIEGFLELPISHTSQRKSSTITITYILMLHPVRATYCPVIYRLSYDKSLSSDKTIKYQVSIIYESGHVETDIPIDSLSDKLQNRMEHIKNKSGVVVTPIEVNIRSSDPRTRNITLVDTPGMIRTDTVDGDPEMVERIDAIVDTVLGQGTKDVIILVEKGTAAPGR